MIDNIDLSKYKRFFAFGCSFTGYWWPTWADVLAKDMPQAEFYNMGYCGAGNLMISNRIYEANLKLKFNKDDLVIVMWSTFCREDRYINNRWECPGNIFTQQVYSENFVKKFADPKGYLIRDLSLISYTKCFLESLKCDSITLLSVPLNFQNEDNEVDSIIKSYSSTFETVPKPMLDLEFNGTWGTSGVSYIFQGKPMWDYHPSPIRYRNYLEKIGFKLSLTSKIFAENSTQNMSKAKSKEELVSLFGNNGHGDAHFSQWW